MSMKPTGIGGPRIYNTEFETREKHRCKERFKTCQRGLTRANNFKPEIQLLASRRMTDHHKQLDDCVTEDSNGSGEKFKVTSRERLVTA